MSVLFSLRYDLRDTSVARDLCIVLTYERGLLDRCYQDACRGLVIRVAYTLPVRNSRHVLELMLVYTSFRAQTSSKLASTITLWFPAV